MGEDIVIGIDLGTTNSCVSAIIDGVPVVIPNRGYLTTPSVIAIAASGNRLVGHAAKRQAITNPEHTLIAMKRLIGRKFEDLTDDPTAARLTIEKGPHDDVRVTLRDQSYSLPELSALILQELRQAAETHLKTEVRRAVITVPAYFNDNQRQATRDAGEIAGLEVLRIINEPTAAAIAYGAMEAGKKTVAVYDLGGGTFDVSVVRVGGKGSFEVLATGGDTMLGGEDFDARIMEWLLKHAREKLGVDLGRDRLALQRLKEAAETAKCALSAQKDAEISLPHIAPGKGGEPLHLDAKLSRKEFDGLITDLVERTISVCDEVVFQSGVNRTKLDDLLLVGGSSRVPSVQSAVTKYFGRSPSQRVNPDEAVAIGAAIHAASVSGGPKTHAVKLVDVTPHTLGILTEGMKIHAVIAKNTQVPTKKQITFGAREGQKNVDFVVMQGDEKEAKKNTLLGRFRMWGIHSVKGAAQLDVTFAIDEDGIVQVSARDRGTGQEQSIRVTASSGLTREEIAAAKTSTQNLKGGAPAPKKTHEATHKAPPGKPSQSSLRAVKKSDPPVAKAKSEPPKAKERAKPPPIPPQPPPQPEAFEDPFGDPLAEMALAESSPSEHEAITVRKPEPLPPAPAPAAKKAPVVPPKIPVQAPAAPADSFGDPFAGDDPLAGMELTETRAPEITAAIAEAEGVLVEAEAKIGATPAGRGVVTRARIAIDAAIEKSTQTDADGIAAVLVDLAKTRDGLRAAMVK